jgi:thiol-disulfide isomerase/thioredoxin
MNMAIQALLRLAVVAACLGCVPAIAAKPGDAEAIPHVDSQGKEGFRAFLAAGKHRAFAIAPGGAWAWKGDEPTTDAAVEGAVQECQNATEQPCVPYAVDDKVVFDAKRWATLWGPYRNRAEAAKAHIGKERGDRFFDLAIKSPAGKPMKLSDLRGKVTVLHFWGTWCPPCRREMPELQKLHQDLGASSGVQLILLQMREDFATARQWAQQQHLTLPMYDSGVKEMGTESLTLANGKTIPDRRMAVAFPTTYVLDKHGIVVFSHVGPIEGWPQYLPLLRDVAAKSGK